MGCNPKPSTTTTPATILSPLRNGGAVAGAVGAEAGDRTLNSRLSSLVKTANRVRKIAADRGVVRRAGVYGKPNVFQDWTSTPLNAAPPSIMAGAVALIRPSQSPISTIGCIR